MYGGVCCVVHSAGGICVLAALGRGLQGNRPKWGRGGASSLEDSLSAAGYGDAGVGEAGSAAVVAEEADGKEGTRVELREDMGLTGGSWYASSVQFACVGAGDGSTIGQEYGDGIDGRALVSVGYLY